jgi:hypothetical protein
VATSANGDAKVLIAAKVHGCNHIGDVLASRDEQRTFVDHAIISARASS